MYFNLALYYIAKAVQTLAQHLWPQRKCIVRINMYTVICDIYYNRRRKTAAATDRKGDCGFMTTGGGGGGDVGNVVYKYNIYYTNMVVVYWSPGINHIFICVGTWRVLYPFAPPPCDAVVCCIPIYYTI